MMIGKGIIPGLLLAFVTVTAAGQNLSHQVMLPGASVVVNAGIHYSQTIGETAVETIGAFDNILTQGFQQPRIKVTIGEAPRGNGVKAYPNPADSYVNIELFGENARKFNLNIININGQMVFSDVLDFSGSHWYVREIPLRGMAKGFYFIRVTSTDGLINRTFKIEKM